MDDLVRWLGEQLTEDERIARAASAAPWTAAGVGDFGWTVHFSSPNGGLETEDSEQGRADTVFIAEHDPARVLREIDSKRQMLDEHQDVNDGSCGTCVDGQWGYPTHGGSSPQRFPCRTLRLLALPYADRPGFRPEWAPTP